MYCNSNNFYAGAYTKEQFSRANKFAKKHVHDPFILCKLNIDFPKKEIKAKKEGQNSSSSSSSSTLRAPLSTLVQNRQAIGSLVKIKKLWSTWRYPRRSSVRMPQFLPKKPQTVCGGNSPNGENGADFPPSRLMQHGPHRLLDGADALLFPYFYQNSGQYYI